MRELKTKMEELQNLKNSPLQNQQNDLTTSSTTNLIKNDNFSDLRLANIQQERDELLSTVSNLSQQIEEERKLSSNLEAKLFLAQQDKMDTQVFCFKILFLGGFCGPFKLSARPWDKISLKFSPYFSVFYFTTFPPKFFFPHKFPPQKSKKLCLPCCSTSFKVLSESSNLLHRREFIFFLNLFLYLNFNLKIIFCSRHT